MIGQYRVGDGNTNPILVTVYGIKDEPYERPSVIVTYIHVPLSEITPEDVAEVLATPGVDAIEIRKEREAEL